MKGALSVTTNMITNFEVLLPYFENQMLADPMELLNLYLNLNQQNQEIFTDCLINAVHREVMKLGLEFCREKNIPVLFQWTDSQGKTISSEELKDQWRRHDHKKMPYPKFSPILHTAMRHAQRMQKRPGSKLKLVQVNGAAPD